MASGHFFPLDLRTHHFDHLDISRPKDGKKKDHDVTAIKRADAATLRDHSPVGRKVIYAWDKDCLDYHLWHRLKHHHGVSYTDLTNEFTLPARLIVIIYRLRWDIEKVFHQLKSGMEERKSWASSPTAKTSHALFECLTHNLTLLFEEYLKENEGLKDELEEQRAKGRDQHRKNREGTVIKNDAADFIQKAIQRATQRTVRFIRWLRSFLYRPVPWASARARLAQIWRVPV